jgi:hypothetical protein
MRPALLRSMRGREGPFPSQGMSERVPRRGKEIVAWDSKDGMLW